MNILWTGEKQFFGEVDGEYFFIDSRGYFFYAADTEHMSVYQWNTFVPRIFGYLFSVEIIAERLKGRRHVFDHQK